MKQTFTVILIFTMIFSVSAQSQKELDSLKTKLETVFMKDQTFRRIYMEAENKLGKDSKEMDYFWEVVEAEDKRLEGEVIEIIEKYGWLGISQVGRLANTAIWSVIQHGSIDTKEKYAPLMKASVLKNESQPMMYARLIDRMLVNAKKPQIYGSQTTKDDDGNTIFFDIIEPEYINQRRKEIGLGKIEIFAEKRGITWNISQKDN